jgi:cellulose synthase/poly-beta-1,6-N-acetylglucosamine synthase-like glycosyltransferase
MVEPNRSRTGTWLCTPDGHGYVDEFITALLCLGSVLAIYSVGVLVLGTPLLPVAILAFGFVCVLIRAAPCYSHVDASSAVEGIADDLKARLKPAGGELCVCLPTYDEAENVRPFVRAVLETFAADGLDGTVLIVDDSSPDGTGLIADRLAAEDARVRVLHRGRKSGSGRACQAGFEWALSYDFELVAQMDCDFSHDPKSLPALVRAAREVGASIGSRYVDGGRVVGSSRPRRLISRFGSVYARLVLGLRIRDLTGGFKCFRADVLDSIESSTAHANGYAFKIELTDRIVSAGFGVQEVPITFYDRTAGRSKMSCAIAAEAARVVLGLRLRRETSRFRGWLGSHRGSVVGTATGLTVVSLAAISPLATLEGLLVVLFLILTLVGVTTLCWMLDAWRDIDSLASTEFVEPTGQPTLSFSLIVPARHEQDVLGATLAQLARQEYPYFEVIVVIGHDDAETRRVALDAIGDDERFRVVTDLNHAKNKPKALNTALPHCGGNVVGIFDAEDMVATGLLRVVDATFTRTGAAVVQGATQLMNHRSSWFAARNALEYYFWFKSRLHRHARIGFIPLGGNSVFVRRFWLLGVGGWDDNCLAEDCDLGARLSALGATTSVAYTAALATREETPDGVPALLRQRTRWSQGFLQVLRKGDWQALPLRARALAVYTLAFPFLQATTCFVLPLAIASIIILHLPIELALFSFLPVVPLVAILAVELVGLSSMRAEFGLRLRLLDQLRLVLGAIPYQVLLGIAAARAAWREARGIRNWEKTAHVGAHL